jgi:hypothetical protein
LESYDQDQVAAAGERPRSLDEHVGKNYQLEAIQQHEISDAQKSELLNGELIYDDDEDSEKRRERR